MTMVWDARDAITAAARMPAAVPPSGFWDNAGAAWDVTEAEDLLVSEHIMMGRAWSTYLGEVERLTGERLGNPGALVPTVESPVDMLGDLAQRGVNLATGQDADKPWAWSARGRYQAAVADTLARVRDLAAQHPDAGVRVLTEQEVMGLAAAEAAERRARLEKVAAGAGAMGVAGQLAGGMGAAVLDPPNMATMAFGAPAGAGILRTALIEGLIGAGTEAVNQPAVADWKAKIGVEFGIGDAAANVATAGAGSALLGGGIAALLKLFGRAKADGIVTETPETRAAELVLEREAAIDAAAPVNEAMAREIHRQQLDATAAALDAGKPLPPDPLPDAGLRSVDELQSIWRTWTEDRDAAVPRVPDAVGMAARLELEQRGWTLRGDSWLQPREPGAAAPRAELPPMLRRPDAPRPTTLIDWLRGRGGVKDEGTELRGIDAGRQRIGLINNSNGMTLDDAARAAWENGYFHGADRPTPNDLLDAITQELQGGPARVRDDELEALQAWNDWKTLTAEVDRLGVDARGMTDVDLQQALGIAHAREAWEPHAQSMPLSDQEMRALVEQARTTGRDLQDVVDDYAETRAMMLEAVEARFGERDEIPFDWEGGAPAERAARMAEAQAPMRARDAEIAALENPDMLVPVPTGALDEQGRMVMEYRPASEIWDELDAEDALAREVQACAIGIAAE